MVSAILTVKCGPALAGLTFVTLGAYMAFTFAVTQVRLPCGDAGRLGWSVGLQSIGEAIEEGGFSAAQIHTHPTLKFSPKP